MDPFDNAYWPTVNPVEFRQALGEFERTTAHARQVLKSSNPYTLGVDAVNRFFSGDDDYTLNVLMRYAVLQKMAVLPEMDAYMDRAAGQCARPRLALYEAAATFPFHRGARIDGAGLTAALDHMSAILTGAPGSDPL